MLKFAGNCLDKLEDNRMIKECSFNNTVSKSKLKLYDRNTKIHLIKLQVIRYTFNSLCYINGNEGFQPFVCLVYFWDKTLTVYIW